MRPLTAWTALILGACSLETAPSIAHKSAALAEGIEAPADSAVVRIEFEEGPTSVRCSGALITPGVVLTAAHCITGQAVEVDCSKTELSSPLPVDHFRVTAEPNLQGTPDDSWVFWRVSELHLVADPGDLLCGNDVALLKLSKPVEDIAPFLVDFSATSDGEDYRVLGYGAGHTSGTGEGIRRALNDQDILCQGVDCEIWSAPGAAGAPARRAPTVESNEFLGSDGACPGDSGGPALFDTSEGEAIRALVTRGRSDCSLPVYTRVPTTIRAFVRAAALEGDYDIPAWALEPPNASGGAPSVDPTTGGAVGSAGEGGKSVEPEHDDQGGSCALSPRRASYSWLLPFILLLGFASNRRRTTASNPRTLEP